MKDDLFAPLVTQEFWHGDCLELMKRIPDGSVDLVVTSPPYDNLRTYNDSLEWSFDIFKPIARELTRCIKQGGVIVWNVADATIKGSETGSSFRQALYFKDECGLNLHDTMIWSKPASFAFDSRQKRYKNCFEYMFVMSKGKPSVGNLIKDKPVKSAGKVFSGRKGRDSRGNLRNHNPVVAGDFQVRYNIWEMANSGQQSEAQKKINHPAVFPIQLANDHIVSWSNPGDVILDPFAGSGTTAIAALNTGRGYICIEKDLEYYRLATERVDNYVRGGWGDSCQQGVTTMNIIYQSKKFREENIVKVYTRGFSNGEIKIIDVDAKNKTIREWWCIKEECPYHFEIGNTVRVK